MVGICSRSLVEPATGQHPARLAPEGIPQSIVGCWQASSSQKLVRSGERQPNTVDAARTGANAASSRREAERWERSQVPAAMRGRRSNHGTEATQARANALERLARLARSTALPSRAGLHFASRVWLSEDSEVRPSGVFPSGGGMQARSSRSCRPPGRRCDHRSRSCW